jgi:hypothetical protein
MEGWVSGRSEDWMEAELEGARFKRIRWAAEPTSASSKRFKLSDILATLPLFRACSLPFFHAPTTSILPLFGLASCAVLIYRYGDAIEVYLESCSTRRFYFLSRVLRYRRCGGLGCESGRHYGGEREGLSSRRSVESEQVGHVDSERRGRDRLVLR